MKLKPEKYSGLNRIQTHDLCDTGVVLYQLSYQSNWELIMCEFVMVKNASEYMKDHIFELRRKIWKHDWSSQLYTQLQQLWNESLKKFRPERDFEPMISAIPVQCSTGWKLIILWVRYIPVDGEEYKWIYERSYICILHHLGVYYELTMWQPPVGLIAQLVEHCTGIA